MSGQTSSPPPRQRLLLIALVLVVACGGGLYYLTTRHQVSTDDASVEADIVAIMAKVPGYVVTLRVDDNTAVKQNQELLAIDPRDYALAVDAAETSLKTTESRAAEARAQVQATAADVAQDYADVAAAQANNLLAAQTLSRKSRLTELSISAEAQDAARANAVTAQAALTSARLKVTASQAREELALVQVRTADAEVAQAQIVLAQARLNLEYTKIIAPVDGNIANRSVVTGNFAQPGQLLLSIVPNEVFIIANFKETQLAGIVPGAHARIRIDALRGIRLNAHVQSIQRGSGSRFALLPPENATGNFVKVVQRIPVKLRFDEPQPRLQGVAPGMSAVVTIDTETAEPNPR